MHSNSLANLKHFPPGQSGNPGGRPKGIVYPVEYLRGMGAMTRAELQAIRDDEDAPISKRAAAEMALQSIGADTERGRREAFSEIADRTTGKPVQDVRIEATAADRSPADLLADLKRRHALPGNDSATLRLPKPFE